MQSLPSVASGAWIVFIKISAVKALRLDGMFAPLFLYSNVRDLYCWLGTVISFSLATFWCWPLTEVTVLVQMFRAKVSHKIPFGSMGCEWSIGGPNVMFRKKVYIYACLNIWEMENPETLQTFLWLDSPEEFMVKIWAQIFGTQNFFCGVLSLCVP